MSGEGQESIPTSADPRSKRPVKKRALSPGSAQAAELDALFARPDQEIRVPSGPRKPRVAAPPEIVTNVQGSSAGAGSGDFHVYKASRRREYERLARMDEEVRREQAAEDFESNKSVRDARDEEMTRKNREKRAKKQAGKKSGKKKTTTNGDELGARAGRLAREAWENPATPPDMDQRNEDGRLGRRDDDSKDGQTSVAADINIGLVIHDDD